MSYRVIALALLLSACSSAPVVERTVAVEVVRDNYVPLPPDFLSPCPNPPAHLKNGGTVGMLRRAYLDYREAYVPCLLGKLDAIKALQP
jgi:hypothetical protein